MIAEVFVALYAGHMVGDHWIQTDHQAQTKEHSRIACLAHVLTYGITQLIFLAAIDAFAGWTPNLWAVAAGMAVNLGTHYWADRRKPLRRLAELTGKGGYWERGGAYPLDQSWHIGWLFITALIIGGTAS